MEDIILRSFLERQREEGRELAAASDIIDLMPLDAAPSSRYLASFHCQGLVQEHSGTVGKAEHFQVGIRLDADYLRRVTPLSVVTLLSPHATFHPNILGPFVCLGRVIPGTPLRDLIFQIYEIISFKRYTVREDDALNPAACAWVRQHPDLLPLDRRPLKRLPATDSHHPAEPTP